MTDAEQKLLDKVGQNLASLEDDGIPDPEAPPVEPTPDPAPADSITPEPTVTPEPEPAPELAANLVRAAVHQGWTENEVKTFYEAAPEQATKTLEKIHSDVNSMSRQWSTLGRKLQDQPAEQPQSQPQPQVQPQTQQSVLSEQDLQKLEQEYSNDPIVDVVRKLNQAITSQPAQIQQPVQMQQPAQIQQPVQQPPSILTEEVNEILGSKIDTFFADETLMADTKFYGLGADWKEINPIQANNRQVMLKEADAIKIGAMWQGEKLTYEQAMAKAHLLMTEPVRSQGIRDDIKSTLQKRAANVTIKPSSSAVIDSDPNKPKSMKQIEDRAEERLKKTFNE